MLPVRLRPLPVNTSLSPPIVSEASLLPESVGYFRISRTASNGECPLSNVHVLLPLGELPLEAHLAGALHSLVMWRMATPLNLHLAGSAAAIVTALRTAGRGAIGKSADAVRVMRSHCFSAHAVRLHNAYARAWQSMHPACDSSSITADLLRLNAPSMLPQDVSFALVWDPTSLLMVPPDYLLAHLERLINMPQSPCVAISDDWWFEDTVGSSTTRDLPSDVTMFAINPKCARAAGWLESVQLQMRSHLTQSKPSQYCPHSLLTRRLTAYLDHGLIQSAQHSNKAHRLQCEWSYQPAPHAAIGHHHLVTRHAEGIASIYVVCQHTVAHQAFAWQWLNAHAAIYEGRSCGCGQRVKVLHYPRDWSGNLISPSSLHERRSVLVDNSVEISYFWMRWSMLTADAWTWLRSHLTADGTGVSRSVVAMADRTLPGVPLVVLAESETKHHWEPQTGLFQAKHDEGTFAHPANTENSAAAGFDRGQFSKEVPLIFPCGYAGAEEAWIPEVLLARCHVRTICLTILAHDAASGYAGRNAWAMVPGAVIIMQSQQMPLVRALATIYGVPLSTLFLVHISDGNIWQERIAETVRRYAAWRHVFRQYWVPDEADSLAVAAELGHLDWFPIGMNPQWVNVMHAIFNGSVSVPAASSRRHFLAFLGSTDKSDRAARINAVNSQINRLHVRSLANAAPGSLGPPQVFHNPGRHSCYGNSCNDEDYVQQMLQSALCLHLPGSSVESNRLYEGLEGGCVPVIVARFGPGEEAVGTAPSTGPVGTALTMAALSPLSRVTGQPPPFIVVEHENLLHGALATLATSSESIDALQQAAMSWWQKAKNHYANVFASHVCPASGV